MRVVVWPMDVDHVHSAGIWRHVTAFSSAAAAWNFSLSHRSCERLELTHSIPLSCFKRTEVVI